MSQSSHGVVGRPAHAVEALGEDAGDRGLADAAGAAEQVGVGDAVQPDGVAQGLDDVVLADDVLEPLRPVAAGDDGVAGRIGGRRRRVGPVASVGPRGSLRVRATPGHSVAPSRWPADPGGSARQGSG